MFNRKTEKSDLEKTIESVQALIDTNALPEEDIPKTIDQIIALHKLTPSRKVTPDTLALIGANLAGILLIISYEHSHVVTSKALSFVSKLK